MEHNDKTTAREALLTVKDVVERRLHADRRNLPVIEAVFLVGLRQAGQIAAPRSEASGLLQPPTTRALQELYLQGRLDDSQLSDAEEAAVMAHAERSFWLGAQTTAAVDAVAPKNTPDAAVASLERLTTSATAREVAVSVEAAAGALRYASRADLTRRVVAAVRPKILDLRGARAGTLSAALAGVFLVMRDEHSATELVNSALAMVRDPSIPSRDRFTIMRLLITSSCMASTRSEQRELLSGISGDIDKLTDTLLSSRYFSTYKVLAAELLVDACLGVTHPVRLER